MAEGMELILLQELNHDCLMHVFNFLELKDQLSAALACQRFHAVLSPMWQKKYRKLHSSFRRNMNTSELHIFLRSICRTLEKLYIFCPDLSGTFPYIRSHIYPNVKSLTLYESGDKCNITDNDVLEMTQVFPNVQKLILNIFETPLTGKHIKNWRFLEHLDISERKPILFDELEKLLEQLQLKSVSLHGFEKEVVQWKSQLAFEKFCKLERIRIRGAQLGMLRNFSFLPNLKELEITQPLGKTMENNDLWNVAKHVTEHKRSDLLELHVAPDFPLDALLGRTYDNLKKIVIDSRHSSEFRKLFGLAPNLREILIFDSHMEKEDIKLWLNSPQMEFVSIQDCWCDFEVLTINARDLAEHRTRLLRFHYSHGARLKIIGESSLLDVSDVYEKPQYYEQGGTYYHCHLFKFC